MKSMSLGAPISINNSNHKTCCSSFSPSFPDPHFFKHRPLSFVSPRVSHPSYFSKSGECQASPNKIVIREARIDDFWEVADAHCSSFFPEYSFPWDLILRVDRYIAVLFGFSVPPGCHRTCLVAVSDETSSFEQENFRREAVDGKISLNKTFIAGILTVDTVANFLPRKGPLRHRRSRIAYISNVAVREKYRRRGVAKRLVEKAETLAKGWGCRSIALHTDLNNPGATRLYKGQGFRCIKVPEGAKWPHPQISPDSRFNFMMKLLNTTTNA